MCIYNCEKHDGSNAEKEELEKNMWAADQIKKLNDKFGLSLQSVSDLDEDTVKLWNNGVNLEKAYAVNHYEEIEKSKLRKRKEQDSGKNHLKSVEGNGAETDDPLITCLCRTSDAEKTEMAYGLQNAEEGTGKL